jgi:hypothetical protein
MTRRIRRDALRWQLATLTERTGKLPLLATLLPVGLLTFWLSGLVPETASKQETLEQMQAQLRVPLPFSSQQPELQQQIDQSEYQQVRQIFDLLKSNGLRVEASRYDLERQGAQQTLRLDIPLQGEYLPLVETLEQLSRMLPLQIEQIALRRNDPMQNQLSATLQLRLLKEGP